MDVDPAVDPDVVADMQSLPFDAGSFDAVWSSHNLEHLYAHEVPVALAEFLRVLKPGGQLFATMPDLQSVAEKVAEGNLTGVLYESPAGPIAALDVLYGHRGYIAGGNGHYAHRTGFTEGSLRESLEGAGFSEVQVLRSCESLALFAKGVKCHGSH